MLERADQGVGQILAALDELGLTRNTIVIFTNDNGGEWLSRNAPLFHRKGTVWEGGIRVPAILRWPGHIPAGAGLGAGRHHDGPDGLDSRGDGRRCRPMRVSKASTCCRCSKGARRRSSGRSSGA